MSTSCISNPPYNMNWNPPMFAIMDNRFNRGVVPPESNANFAFILSALEMIEDKCAMILPNSVLSTTLKEEFELRKELVETNLIEAIIMCPDGMFESTSIPVCVILFNKRKETSQIEMIDMRNQYAEETREQRGQFGGEAHTNRIYKKKVNVFTDEHIKLIVEAIENKSNDEGICRSISIEDAKEQDYNLTPSRYIEKIIEETKRRSIEEIIEDINRVVKDKNNLKLTINETLAREIGLLDIYQFCASGKASTKEFNEGLSFTESRLIDHDYISLTKNAKEIKFENNSKDTVSSILMMTFQMWKQHIYYLNTEENRYLVELRDTLLPLLMNGEISLESE